MSISTLHKGDDDDDDDNIIIIIIIIIIIQSVNAVCSQIHIKHTNTLCG